MSPYETDFSSLFPEEAQPAAPAEAPQPEEAQPETLPQAEAVAAEEAQQEAPAPQPEETESPEPVPVAPAKASPFADSPYVNAVPAAQPAKAAPRKKGSGKWLQILAVTVSILAILLSVVAIAIRDDSVYLNQIQALQQQIKDLEEQIKDNSFTGNGNSISGTPSSPNGLTPGQVYARNLDSVVLIQATTTAGTSTGSGFVLSEDGYVITNYHVVEGGTAFTVVTSDGTQYPAALTGGDETNDLAVLKVEATNLDPAELGSSDDLIVGDQVVAIGNPLGDLTSTLTVGYISAKDRDVSTDGSVINMLQTDAAINSGNSGGPLFNMKGQVIGITTAKYSGATSSGASIEGIGFAIPIDDVKPLISELIEKGYVSRPYMGVSIRNMAEGIGLYVENVEMASPAHLAGIRRGDIIVQLGSTPVTSIGDLSRALYDYSVGDTVSVTVYRNRQLLELKITFTEKPRSGN